MRPEGWKCPYLGKKANRYFELGADAMLEGLKKVCDEDDVDSIVVMINPENGEIELYIKPVFIPEGKERKGLSVFL